MRTMGCLRVDKIIDYLTEPLRKCLKVDIIHVSCTSFNTFFFFKKKKDENPYVRKTAAVCVAKLYDLNPTLAIEQDFVNMVKDMIADVNPMVVANAVIALSDMNDATPGKNIFEINSNIANKLLHALNECTE